MQQLQPEELAAWLAESGMTDAVRPQPVLVDVREPWEYQLCRIEESLHIPMNTIPARFSELDSETPIVLICHHGTRSFQVGMFLEQQGFKHLYNLQGGVNAWARSVEPGMALY